MSGQRCSKCKGHGHNRLTCGKATPRNSGPILPIARDPSPRAAKGINSGAVSPATPTKQENAYGALYGAFAASQATSLKKQPRPPAADIVHTPVDDREAEFTVYAEIDGQRVGEATFQPTLHGNDAMVVLIKVHKDFRLRGIARQMWEKAKELGFEPVHSLRRTSDGDAFAAAVGGPTPPNLAFLVSATHPRDRPALDKTVWDWYASRPTKRLPRHLREADQPRE